MIFLGLVGNSEGGQVEVGARARWRRTGASKTKSERKREKERERERKRKKESGVLNDMRRWRLEEAKVKIRRK